MKKAILLLCMAAGLVSCAKNILDTEKDNTKREGIPMTFNVSVLETKAAKTDWADGDKIYVFFNGLETKYLMLERSSGAWTNTSGGGTLLDTDFSGLGTKTLTAVHFPITVDVAYADSKFSFTNGGKPVYNYYLFETGKDYTVDGTTVTATLSMGKPADMVQIHVAGIQANVSDYTFGCTKIKPVACASVGTDGAITECVLQAGARLSGIADADGGIFAGRLTKPDEAADYKFTVASDDYIYTLTRSGKTLTAGKMYNFPALTDGTNWTVTAAPDLYVDLGIEVGGKKIYWAKCNLGATTETDYGSYFSWGEVTGYTEGKTKFAWDAYYYGGATTLTKYCNLSSRGKDGFTDELTILEKEDDAAYAAFGGKFRMPTKDECAELIATKSNTAEYTWTWCNGSTEKYNDTTVKGWKIVKKVSGATLFLPVAGYREGTASKQTGIEGFYWSSSLYLTNYPADAWSILLQSNNPSSLYYQRHYGFSVRPVFVE